jgi:hypothetical protein
VEIITYSYVETPTYLLESTSFVPAKTELAVKLLKINHTNWLLGLQNTKDAPMQIKSIINRLIFSKRCRYVISRQTTMFNI